HASMLGVRKSAEAAGRLIANTLTPDDLVGIFTSSGTGIVDFTKDHKALLAALAKLDAHPLSGVHTGTCPTLNGEEAFIITQHADMGIEDAAVAELVGCKCPPLLEQRVACEHQQRGMLPLLAQNIWDQYKYQSTTSLDLLLIVIRHLA